MLTTMRASGPVFPSSHAPIELTVPFRARRLVGAAVAIAVAATTIGVAVPFGRADATAPDVITGRLSGKADFTNTSAGTTKVVTSGYGRFTAFTNASNNAVPGLPSGTDRVYVRDTLTDALELVSVTSAGAPASSSQVGAITPDGRFVIFVSLDPLVPADNNDDSDVYLRDRKLKTTELVSVSNTEQIGDDDSGGYGSSAKMDISDDGRYVVYDSAATNLVGAGGDTNGFVDVYRRDRQTGTTARVSQNGGTAGDGDSRYPSMSADGVTVAFATYAKNLTTNDSGNFYDIAVRRMDGALTPVRASVGLDANANGHSNLPDLSADGKKVVFASNASDLVASDTNGFGDVFLRNLQTNTTTRMSVWDGGIQIPGLSDDASISPNGNRVTFETKLPSSVSDGDALSDVYLREGSSTTRQSRSLGASDTSHEAYGNDVSDNTVVWVTQAKMASIDTDANGDAYVRRTGFAGPHASWDSLMASSQQRILGTNDAAKTAAAVTAVLYGAAPEHQITNMVDQPVFSAKKAPVTRLYWAYFTRRPDLGGLNYWIKQYANGKSLQKISLQFAQSSEFKTKYGNTTSTQFVTLVYQNVLERQPEADGLAYWAKKIDNGTSRGQVMTSFSESPEGKRVMAPYVDTVLIALGLMGQIPSQLLFDAAVGAIKQGQPKEIVVDYVLGTPDYAATL